MTRCLRIVQANHWWSCEQAEETSIHCTCRGQALARNSAVVGCIIKAAIVT